MGQSFRTGILYLDDCKRYSLREQDVEPEDEVQFSSGRAIDIRLGGRWIAGSVEYSQKRGGYYFTDGTNWCPLAEGMQARSMKR